jgi:general secretion pathway protein L
MREATATAILLPEEVLLRRRLQLPFLSPAGRREAIELALAGASPFPAEETIHGWHAIPSGVGEDVELVLASRKHVAHYFGRKNPAEVEVWAPSSGEAGAQPIVMQGHGENIRFARVRRRYLQIVFLFLLVLALLPALVASPVARKRQDVLDFNARVEAQTREVAPVVDDRNALAKANVQLLAIAAYADARPDPLVALGRLSAQLSDSVYLTHFEQRGRTVVFGGLAENAAGLVEALGSKPGFNDMRSSGINRDPVSGRESFSIEFHIDVHPVATDASRPLSAPSAP